MCQANTALLGQVLPHYAQQDTFARTMPLALRLDHAHQDTTAQQARNLQLAIQRHIFALQGTTAQLGAPLQLHALQVLIQHLLEHLLCLTANNALQVASAQVQDLVVAYQAAAQAIIALKE